MSECPRHEDLSRRIIKVEDAWVYQTEENAKLWKALNVIREEKATDVGELKSLIIAVAELKQQLKDGLNELRSEIALLKLVPAKRWETVITTIITALVSGGIGVGIALLVSHSP